MKKRGQGERAAKSGERTRFCCYGRGVAQLTLTILLAAQPSFYQCLWRFLSFILVLLNCWRGQPTKQMGVLLQSGGAKCLENTFIHHEKEVLISRLYFRNIGVNFFHRLEADLSVCHFCPDLALHLCLFCGNVFFLSLMFFTSLSHGQDSFLKSLLAVQSDCYRLVADVIN